MLPTHDVECPFCGKFLYTALSLENVVDADAPTSPKVEFDAQGNFMRCEHCKARVPMKPVVTIGGRRGFRLAEEVLRTR
jgi:DNA-directed RNA polymerase subunit RPC12/RpoP